MLIQSWGKKKQEMKKISLSSSRAALKFKLRRISELLLEVNNKWMILMLEGGIQASEEARKALKLAQLQTAKMR